MIATIEWRSARGYVARMRSIVLRLLSLIAVLLMPLGMTAAPATAAVEHHHGASMPMEHCPEQGFKHRSNGVAECTMACAAALPAFEAVQAQPVLHAAPLMATAPVHELCGLHPETATPPPKIA